MASHHQELLEQYCRICGKRTISKDGVGGIHIRQSQVFLSLLSHLHDIEESQESDEIFPKKICQRCIQKFRSVRVSVDSKPEARVSVFDLISSFYVYHGDDDLRLLARKFPVADFWAHSSSSLQQCGVCEDAAATQNVVASENDSDQIRTCHILVRENNVDSGEDTSTSSVKSYKILDIKDIFVMSKKLKDSPDKRSHDPLDGGPEAKKVKLGNSEKGGSSPGSSGSGGANSPNTYQTLWPIFNEVLGKNRRYRSDKISEVLSAISSEVPRVIADLKSSGINFSVEDRQSHFDPNADFKKSTMRCLGILKKLPTPKKSLMMFRAITETASDGQLNILAHVGFTIDLSNPTLAFLVRRIKNSRAAHKSVSTPSESDPNDVLQSLPQSVTISKIGKPSPASKKRVKAKVTSKPDSSDSSEVGISKNVLTSNSKKAKSSNSTKSPSSKAPQVTITPIAQSTVPPLKIKPSASSKTGPSSSGTKSKSKKKGNEVHVRPELLDDANINVNLVQTKIRQLNSQLPMNRQMKADIVRDVLLRRDDTKDLMSTHGILFDPDGGNYHLKALDQQRGNGRKKFEKLTSNLNVHEWRACLAAVVYELLHPEDSLTLRIIGIYIDPTHEKVPLHFRLNFALKRALLMSPYSSALMSHLFENVQVEAKGDIWSEVWETGLVELLYCDKKDAKKLFNSGVNLKSPQATQKVPPIVVSKGKISSSASFGFTKGKGGSKKTGQLGSLGQVSRNPVVVQLRPKKGSVPAPTVVPLMPKLGGKFVSKSTTSARSKKKPPETYYNTKAKVEPGDTSARGSRRATRNQTEERIHQMAQFESLSENDFEDNSFAGPPVPQGPETEQDPLFDPLSIQDVPLPSNEQYPPTEGFVTNMVEIKTELVDEYESPLHDSGGAADVDDEVEVQDDLEHSDDDGLQMDADVDNHLDRDVISAMRVDKVQPDVTVAENFADRLEPLLAGVDHPNPISAENPPEEPFNSIISSQSVESRLTAIDSEMNPLDVDDHSHDNFPVTDDAHSPLDETEAVQENVTSLPAEQVSSFSNLQITNVESGKTSAFDDGTSDKNGMTHFDENTMQELEEMLNFTQVPPSSSADPVGFEKETTATWGRNYEKEPSEVGGGNCDNVDSIIQEVAGLANIPFTN